MLLFPVLHNPYYPIYLSIYLSIYLYIYLYIYIHIINIGMLRSSNITNYRFSRKYSGILKWNKIAIEF